MGRTTIALWALIALCVGATDPSGDDRLYGRVVTAGGRVYEGFIRWDKNEGSWADVLDGSKEIPWANRRDAERLDESRWERRERRIDFLGIHISWTEGGDEPPSSAASGIRFGHLRSLEVIGDDRARLTLKSGEEVELEGGSTDIGDELRGLVVDDAEHGEVELRWADVDVVEFMAPPDGAPAPPERRLYGTLRTREGSEFTGYVAWDTDEILGSDILDGKARGRDREISFDEIAAIERESASSARVVLSDGEELVLRGSNDVNEGNRGITVSDPALGRVTVSWDEFEELTFEEAPAGEGYDMFDGGRPLYGAVETVDGDVVEGAIRWDNDESRSWELLNGRVGGVEMEVEFGQIATIRRLERWGAEVTLLDGRTIELEGSNDVDEGNKGIYVVRTDGETVLVPWRDVGEVRFESP